MTHRQQIINLQTAPCLKIADAIGPDKLDLIWLPTHSLKSEKGKPFTCCSWTSIRFNHLQLYPAVEANSIGKHANCPPWLGTIVAWNLHFKHFTWNLGTSWIFYLEPRLGQIPPSWLWTQPVWASYRACSFWRVWIPSDSLDLAMFQSTHNIPASSHWGNC